MLTSTFCCFEGLTSSAERRLWGSGCLGWRDLLVLNQPVLSAGKLGKVRAQIRQAEVALESGLADWFLNRLKPPDSIRVLPHFLEGSGYLDIETTGLGRADRVTTVALYTGRRKRCYVRGRNLDDLLRELRKISLLITYNGSSFDLPRLRKEFRIDLAIPHLDLRPCLDSLGYRGGLKRCEALMGIERPGDEAQSGLAALDLWSRYEEEGDEAFLLHLLRYNLRDVLSLELLAVRVYNLVMGSHPGAMHLPVPRQPSLDLLELQDVL